MSDLRQYSIAELIVMPTAEIKAVEAVVDFAKAAADKKVEEADAAISDAYFRRRELWCELDTADEREHLVNAALMVREDLTALKQPAALLVALQEIASNKVASAEYLRRIAHDAIVESERLGARGRYE
tara:strand:+ start:3462 stop:3845 length:384 start_codon:yes stop_codon:yes gene_type:complete